MAHNDMVMSCDEINKLLKRFQEDLLSEDEYQAFLAHIDNCSNCKEYVRSIGSLSIRLWELGDIKVPQDFSSTIFYKLSHPVEEARPNKSVVSKKWIIGIIILIILSALLFLVHRYIKTGQGPQDMGNAPTVVAEIIRKSEPPNDRRAKFLLDKLKAIAGGLGAPENGMVVKESRIEKVVVKEKTKVAENYQIKDVPLISEPKSLHWHFRCLEVVNNAALEGEIGSIELNIRKNLADKQQLETEIADLKKKEGAGLGEYYSKDALAVRSDEQQELSVELQKKLKEASGMTEKIKDLEDRKRRLESELRGSIKESKLTEAKRKTELLNTLSAAGVKADYQADNLLTFYSNGKKIEDLLGQILSLSTQAQPLNDFTSNVVTVADNEYNVSVYLEQDPIKTLHWHIDPIIDDKKSSLIELIKKHSSSIDYESERLVVFSIQDTELKKLRVKIQATRVPFLEYGYIEGRKQGSLSSGPIRVSVYLLK
ncbi:zf-HC2 domain-containing protein [Candidatus Omnitrophota bacterium]